MRQPEQPREIFPGSTIPPIVVLRELCQVAGRAYISDDWKIVLGVSPHSSAQYRPSA
jgi:hypothetical protein